MESLGKNNTRRSTLATLALVFACFTLSSAGYLAWLYHLIELQPPVSVDALAMGMGYSFQAIGLIVAACVVRARPAVMGRVVFVVLVALHFTCAAPAALSDGIAGALAFGFAMNVLCGFISMFYLLNLTQLVDEKHRGIVFGGGYALSIVTSWLLSVAGVPIAGVSVELVSCAAFSLLAVGIAAIVPFPLADVPAQEIISREARAAGGTGAVDEAGGEPWSVIAGAASGLSAKGQLIVLACFVVLLMSMVKNMGFSFPSADIGQTVNLETSRLFYAGGLVIAGLVVDRSRKLGSILCMASLVIPFVMLALVNEPVSSAVFWAIGYFFFGFFSVFRVVLFADLAADEGRVYLSALGLMFGHFGDALGVVVCLSLGGSAVALVAVAAMLFAVTVFVFYQLFQQLYMRPAAPERSERELFDAFAARYALSPREREVLRLVLDDQTNAEIAATLFVSESTVKFHMRNALKKTGCKNRMELLAKYAGDRGLAGRP